MGASELERIARLAQRFGPGGPGVLLGIGDDAAVLEPPTGTKLVWTVDDQVEGTHFRRDLASWADVGFRSFMAAASDIAAMGAEPWCALSALVLPVDLDDDAFDALTEGQRLAAEEVGSPIVGGNLARGPVVVVTTSLIGRSPRPVERRGARPGDELWLAGEVGLARAGMLALERRLVDPRMRAAISAWLRPRALIELGLRMAASAHAAIDVSDGLAADAGHLAEASGVAVLLEEECLRSHAAPRLVHAAEALGLDALDLALHGGEDYALVVACDQPIPGFVRVGRVREGEGVFLVGKDGERAIEPRGFDHFRA